MVALAAACAGTSAAQVPVASFELPVQFNAPFLPVALAATPEGADWVSPTAGIAPDGYPEVAVAGAANGLIHFYRNENVWGSNPTGSLTKITFFDNQDLNVFDDLANDLVGTAFLPDAWIYDIELVEMTGDDAADLVVAFSYRDPAVSASDRTNGAIALYEATDVGLNNFRFIRKDCVAVGLPISGIDIADFGQDGLMDIVVATSPEAQPSTPNAPDSARVFVVENNPIGATAAGDLELIPDEFLPNMNEPSLNVVAGEMKRITSGGLGGTGNTLDFATFGGNSGNGIRLVAGSGIVPAPADLPGISSDSFSPPTVETTPDCGSAGSDGLSGGSGFPGVANEEVYEIELFDPFANANQSLAASTATQICLMHNKPRNGSFFRLCIPGTTTSADIYDMLCNESIALTGNTGHFAVGRLNGDAFDDIMHINGANRRPSILLGRGTPDASNRILQFECTSNYRLPVYFGGSTPGGEARIDRVRCADLNLDGRDDIMISAHGTPSKLVVYINNSITSSGPN